MKFKKIKYFKNFLSNLDFNFDTLTDILNTSELHQYIKAEPTDTINFRKVFDHIYQVKQVETTTYLNPVYNLLIDKIKRLQPNTLDLDYLEEKLRKNTGFSKKNEIVVVFD